MDKEKELYDEILLEICELREKQCSGALKGLKSRIYRELIVAAMDQEHRTKVLEAANK